MMEKYAVVLDDEKTKTSGVGEGQQCPSCGRDLHRPDFCRNCGTEPFEKQPEKK